MINQSCLASIPGIVSMLTTEDKECIAFLGDQWQKNLPSKHIIRGDLLYVGGKSDIRPSLPVLVERKVEVADGESCRRFYYRLSRIGMLVRNHILA